MLGLRVKCAWQEEKLVFRLTVEVAERTIDKTGRHLVMPAVELQGWWTSLEVPMPEVIALYQDHGSHEQLHSEIKSDLELERLPSGNFDTNDATLHLASFAYNCLRLLGQLRLTGKCSPVKHPAQRMCLRTVFQKLMYRAAQFVTTARLRILAFGAYTAQVVPVFAHQQALLWAALPMKRRHSC